MNKRQAKKLLRALPRTWRQRREVAKAEAFFVRRDGGVPVSLYMSARGGEILYTLDEMRRVLRGVVHV